MIDLIRADILNPNVEAVRNCPIITDWHHHTQTDEHGEVKAAYSFGNYKGVQLKIIEPTIKVPYQRLKVSGSLHKMANDGVHNYDDFNIHRVSEAVEELAAVVKSGPENWILRCLENGVNIDTPGIDVDRIVDSVLFNGAVRFEFKDTAADGRYKVARGADKNVKAYRKHNPEHTKRALKSKADRFRWELHYNKMRELNALGVSTMADLLTSDLQVLSNCLIGAWEKVHFFDWVALDNHPQRDEFGSLNYWHSMLGITSKGRTISTRNFRRQRQAMNEAILASDQSIKSTLKKHLSEKVENLLFPGSQIVRISPFMYSVNYGHSTLSETTSKEVGKNHEIGGENLGESTGKKSESKNSDSTTKKEVGKLCLVTGLNIDMQRKDSALLGVNGLRYYHEHDKGLFEVIRRKYLGSVWYGSPFEIQLKELAHNIRNHYYNKLYSQKARKERLRGQSSLFDMIPHKNEENAGERRKTG